MMIAFDKWIQKSAGKGSSRWIIVLAGFLMLGGAGLFAQSSLIEVRAEVDKSEITVGDPIRYTLIIDRAKDLSIQSPGKGANLGMFEIRDYRVYPPEEKEGRILERFDYFISVYDTGHYVIPPFTIAFQVDDSSAYQFISSEPIDIYVRSVLTAEDREIRDIKPPLSIPVDYRRWILLGALALLLIGAAAVGYWYYRRRQKGAPLFRKEIIRPAHEIALEELERLLAQGWIENGEYKAFYTGLSLVLRRYVEGRFFIKALEETTTELMASLEEANLSVEDMMLIQSVLSKCDLVKFAKYQPDVEETHKAVQAARTFIEHTRLEFEPVEHKEPITEGTT